MDRSDLIRADVTGARQSLLNLIRFFYANRAPILHAIEAFKNVTARIPEAHFAIVGSGALEEECRAAVAEANLEGRVHFAGYQTNVQDWLAAATVWYLPTESENFSLAVLEALAAGCAVVSTNCPGNDEVLIDGDNSLLTEVGDVDAQAAALYSLLTDESLRTKLKSAARAVAQNYSADRMVEAYAQCYSDRKSA